MLTLFLFNTHYRNHKLNVSFVDSESKINVKVIYQGPDNSLYRYIVSINKCCIKQFNVKYCCGLKSEDMPLTENGEVIQSGNVLFLVLLL